MVTLLPFHLLTFRHRVNNPHNPNRATTKNIRFQEFADWQLFIFVRKTYLL